MGLVDSLREILMKFLYSSGTTFQSLESWEQSGIMLVCFAVGTFLLFYFIRTILRILFSWIK